jgi:hypothetical protein
MTEYTLLSQDMTNPVKHRQYCTQPPTVVNNKVATICEEEVLGKLCMHPFLPGREDERCLI